MVSCTSLAVGAFVCYIALAVYQLAGLFYPDLSAGAGVRIIEPLWSPAERCDIRVFISTESNPINSLAAAQQQSAATAKMLASGGALPFVATVPRSALVWESLNADPHTALSHAVNVTAWTLLLGPDPTPNACARANKLASDKTPLLTAHVWIHRNQSASPSPLDPIPVYLRIPLTKQMAVARNDTRNLLAASADTAAVNASAAPPPPAVKSPPVIAPHFRTKLAVRYVNHYQPFPFDKIPADIAHAVRWHNPTAATKGRSLFLPIVYADELFETADDFVLFNTSAAAVNVSAPATETAPLTLSLRLSFSPILLGFYRLSQQLRASLDLFEKFGIDGTADESGGGGGMKETDQMKKLFGGTNPILLAITFAVSLLHLLFDFLAFKNDVAFWRSQKSFTGLSSRSLLLHTAIGIVILLYLIDNEASKLVLVSAVSQAVINCWKLTKLFRVRWTAAPLFGVVRVPCGLDSVAVPPPPNSKRAEIERFDAQAMYYLGLAFIPLVCGAGVYSLLYRSHKSWYSWGLGSVALMMYVGGFIMMTPQLFLNYKLKSVTHLPWRVFVYKALNTFIDDLFAFVLDGVPIMHRLSVFRDDIVFLVFLYQRWIYRNNPQRTYDDDNDAGAAATAAPTTTTTTTTTTADTAVVAATAATASASATTSTNGTAATTDAPAPLASGGVTKRVTASADPNRSD